MPYQVLVIDDNAINRRYVKSVVEREGITVFESADGLNGISMAEKILPDLILVDIQMPEMDGFECLRALQKIKSVQGPILAITAFSSPENKEHFISKGFQDYITKPVKPPVLANIVNYWLKNTDKKEAQEFEEPQVEFDNQIKEELIKHVGSSGVEELYEEFEEELHAFLKQLIILNSSENYNDICSILHTIKGNAGSLGFFRLSDIAFQLETKIELGQTESLTEELLEFKAYAKQLFLRSETHFKTNT